MGTKESPRLRAIGLVALSMFFASHAYAKDITVKIGVAMDLTGPLSSDGRKMVNAWRAYEDYLNNVKGGWKDVAGNSVKLQVLHGDTGFTPQKTVSLYKKFKEDGAVVIVNTGSVELAAIRNALLEDKMPTPTNSGALIYPLPSPAFGHWPDYSAVSAAVIDYVKQKWDQGQASSPNKRAPKLAFVGPEGYPSWEAAITPEVMRYAKLHGVEVVGKFFIPLRAIDTKPQVLAAKNAGADFIYTGVVSSQGGAVIRDLYDLGLKGDPTKTPGKIEIIGMFPMQSAQMIKLAGGRKEAVEGLLVVGGHAYVWEDQLTLRLVRKYAEKYGDMEGLDSAYVHEWFSAMYTDKAIELALQKVSGDKLKGADVTDAFFRIRNFDSGGIVPGTISFSEESRVAMEKVRIERVEGGHHVLVTYTDYKMLAPIYTEEYAKKLGKKSIYADQALNLLKLTADQVGYRRIKE